MSGISGQQARNDAKYIQSFIADMGSNLEKFGAETGDSKGAVESLKVWSMNILRKMTIES